METTKIELFADYFQFYIQDDDINYGDLSDSWSKEAVDKLLAVADHVVGVGTVRNMDVPVTIVVADVLPELDPTEWDRINKCTLECATGRLVIAGCTDYFPDAKRISVHPGKYDVIVGYKDLDKLSEDGLDGEDSYHLFLAPSQGKNT